MVTRSRIIDQLDALELELARAFRESVNRIRDQARLQRLADNIESRDLVAAVRSAGIRSDAVWRLVTEATRGAYIAGGDAFASTAPARFDFIFDMNNPRAEEWLRQNATRQITDWTQEQRQVVTDTLTEGLARGQNPRKTALDLAGRVDRRTGRRIGGQIVLNQQQAGAVRKASEELRTGTKNSLGSYLSRKRRDKRFDKLIKRAIKSGESLSDADIARIVGRYSDRLLQLRAETIARTETLNAFNSGAQESLKQAVDEGLVNQENIQRVWRDASDGRVRDQHEAVDGTSVGLDEPFIVGGESLMFPGDPRTASPSNIVNCRCVVRQIVDWIAETE